jgi:1,4-dihydroxy-6-naphthoate synthase
MPIAQPHAAGGRAAVRATRAQEAVMHQRLRLAYTPDPDDAFHYCALETGRIAPPPGVELVFEQAHIRDLNASCRRRVYDACAISSVFYPEIEADYAILASGASVGRGYGPVLGGRVGEDYASLAGRRVAVPGDSTTGTFLLRYFYSGFTEVPLPFDEVAAAIADGRVDAGVLIHEELLNFAERRVGKVCCLGERWFAHSGLPLPVGLIVGRRGLGRPTLQLLENLLHDSMAWALAHPAAAMECASRFGRGPASLVREEFVAKFANADTLLMPSDVRLGLSSLYTKALRRGLIDHLPRLDIIDPAPPRAAA